MLIQAIARDIDSKATVLDAVQKEAESLSKDLAPEESEALKTEVDDLAKKYTQLKEEAEKKQLRLAQVRQEVGWCLERVDDESSNVAALSSIPFALL